MTLTKKYLVVAIRATKASIRHWKRMQQQAPSRRERPRVSDCALCKEYYEDNCEGCPISLKTGRSGCMNTPYEEAREAHVDYLEYGGSIMKWREKAQKEIDFLKEVLADLEVKQLQLKDDKTH